MDADRIVLTEIKTDDIGYTDMRQLLDNPHAMEWTAYRVQTIGDDGYIESGNRMEAIACNGRAAFCSGGDSDWSEVWADYRNEPTLRDWIASLM